MKFFRFLILLYLLLGKGISDTLNSKYYDIIKSSLAHYRSHSAILIYDGNGTQWEIRDMVAYINLQKLISYKDFYFSSLMTLPTLSKALRNDGPVMRETIAALEFNENIIRFLSKASKETVMASYKWFLTTSSTSQNLDAVTVPSDCEFIIAQGNPEEGYELSEMYNVDRSRKLKKTLGRWRTGDQFHINASLDLFTRRQNFEGAVIKSASPKTNACLFTSFSDNVSVFAWCIYHQIWDMMSDMLNIRAETLIVPGLNAEFLEKSDVEFTFRHVFMNSADMDTRSFVWPTFRGRVMVVTSYIVHQVEWKTFIFPFSNEMWIVVLLWIVTCDLILTTFELITNEKKRGNFFSLYRSKFSFAAAFTICNQGVLGPSKQISIRIIFTMMLIVPAVLFPGYSAKLTSFLTVQLQEKPFQSLEELSRLKEYKIGWNRLYPLRHVFNLEDKSPLNQALLQNNVLPFSKLSRTDVESVERLCKEKFVMLTLRDTVFALKPKCSTYMLKQHFKLIFSGLEIKKNSWYKYFMDRCERKVDCAGISGRIAEHAVMKEVKYKTLNFVEKEHFKPIKMENIILPFAVLLLGVVSSAFLLLLEIICFKKNSAHSQKLRKRLIKKKNNDLNRL